MFFIAGNLSGQREEGTPFHCQENICFIYLKIFLILYLILYQLHFWSLVLHSDQLFTGHFQIFFQRLCTPGNAFHISLMFHIALECLHLHFTWLMDMVIIYVLWYACLLCANINVICCMLWTGLLEMSCLVYSVTLIVMFYLSYRNLRSDPEVVVYKCRHWSK